MTGQPVSPSEEEKDEFDFDLELDDLDDAALQRLLDEDPDLEKELQAIQSTEAIASSLTAVEEALRETSSEPPPLVDDAFADDTEMDSQDVAHVTAEEGETSGQAHGLEVESYDSDSDFDDLLADDDDDVKLGPADSSDEPAFVAAPSHDDLVDFETNPTADDIDVPPVTERVAEAETDAELTDEERLALDLRPVPRINVHAFCVSDNLTELVERAAADRRLAKAHLTIQSGDAIRAAELYGSETTPNLIIIEAGESAQDLLTGLDSLAQVCDPSTRVIVVGNINDIRLYRELMDRGISEYLVNPRSPLQLIGAVGMIYSDPSAPPIGKTFVFVGARGGTGSSTVCHNVAWTLAEDFASDTILMDLDLAFGTASLDFEHDPNQGLAEALNAPERLDDVLLDRLLQKCTDRLSLFVAPNLLDRDYDYAADNFESVIDTVRKSAPNIIIDMPHVWTSWSRFLLQTADEIILTVTPDLSSFRNAKNIVETIKQHRENDSPPILVINQQGVPKRPEVPSDQFEEALGLEAKAIIPWEPVAFGNAATNAEPLSEGAPKSKATLEMQKIASLLVGRGDAEVDKSGFNLKSLFAKIL